MGLMRLMGLMGLMRLRGIDEIDGIDEIEGIDDIQNIYSVIILNGFIVYLLLKITLNLSSHDKGRSTFSDFLWFVYCKFGQ
jgi:hypothetical protein